MLTAFLTPVMILITGLLIPLGIIDKGNFNYHTLHAFATSWYGAIIILVLVSLPLWHTMHRIFHGLHDLGIKRGRGLQKVVSYGFAFAISVFTFIILLQMF
jgi:fumarate reductase subunit D